ncbi:MAG: FHA domain-containing protein [Solirubrobacteraceae bacterium]
MSDVDVPTDQDGLLVLQGPAAGRWIPLEDGSGTLGRVPGTITLDDGEVSRRHADVRVVDGALELTDLGSANGTFVRGRRLAKPELLYDRDTFRVGGTEIEVRLLPVAPEATIVAPRPADDEGDITAEHHVPIDVPLTPPAYGSDDLVPAPPAATPRPVSAPEPSAHASGQSAAPRPASIPEPPAHTPELPHAPEPAMASHPAPEPMVPAVPEPPPDAPAPPRDAPAPRAPRRREPGLPDAPVMPTVGSGGLAPQFAPRAVGGPAASRISSAALFTYAVIVVDVIALIVYFATRG